MPMRSAGLSSHGGEPATPAVMLQSRISGVPVDRPTWPKKPKPRFGLAGSRQKYCWTEYLTCAPPFSGWGAPSSSGGGRTSGKFSLTLACLLVNSRLKLCRPDWPPIRAGRVATNMALVPPPNTPSGV